MNNLTADLDVHDMDIHSAKRLRKKLSSRISAIRVTDTIRLESKISAEKKTAMEITIGWLFDHNLIPSKTKYSFLKFAVENLIKQVLQERKQEELKQLQSNNNVSQEEPIITNNAQIRNKGTGVNE